MAKHDEQNEKAMDMRRVTSEPLDHDDGKLASDDTSPAKLKYNFNIWSLAFMSFCTGVTWEAIGSTIAQAFTSGGSSSLVWGFLASATGALITVLCISEYASMIPCAGGQHQIVAVLAPPRWRRVLAWYTGWITVIGWVLCALAGVFSTAMQIQSWAILFSPDYVYERWHTSMIVIGLTTFYTLFAIYEIKALHYLLFLAMGFHVIGYFATAIYLLANVNPKNTAEYTFTDSTNLSGWDNPAAGWLIGLLTTAIGFVSWDSPMHMAEETEDPARDTPRSLITAVLSSGIATFPWIIAVAFCITDVNGVLSGPVGTISFMAQLFYNVSGGSQAVVIGMTCYLPVMGICGVGSSVMSVASRIVWAFAREGGLPAVLGKVSSRTNTPIWSLVFVWACVCGLSLVYIGNTTAFYGLSSACAVALLISYALPVAMNVIWGFENCHLPRKHFTLGKYHRPLAVVAMLWCFFLATMLCFPVYLPTSAVNMNYAPVVLGAGVFAASVAWFTYGARNYVCDVEALQGRTVN
ncbi:hypothetical protein E8E14_001709 [Neopestalotiopsis sp. 37M]|nr:hypothetical protein E8E14_001709 [Neopestalotiopsis sp. 37M]